jgi:hypothetical protein
MLLQFNTTGLEVLIFGTRKLGYMLTFEFLSEIFSYVCKGH